MKFNDSLLDALLWCFTLYCFSNEVVCKVITEIIVDGMSELDISNSP